MKDKSTTMSRKHDKERHSHKRHNTEETDTYKHVLKERHYKDEERNRKKDRDKNSEFKQASHSHKSKRSASPQRSYQYKSSSPSKSKNSSNNHRKHENQEEGNDVNESYEELSRRKRKLESELRALDLEEAAAAKEAENKKARREKPEKSRKTREDSEPRIKKKDSDEPRYKRESDLKIKAVVTVKKEPDVRVKREHNSDDDRSDVKKQSKNKSRHSDIKIEKGKHKKEEAASKSSGDEKGWGLSQNDTKKSDKEKPNFETSGKLAEETNTYNGVVIKYNEPSEARKPKRRWRLYPFKGDSDLPFIPIHRQSAYLFGRTRLIADIPIDHPSCSKQHAVLQFRLVPYQREDGTTGRRVRPYIIDLESSNGTFVNNNKIDPRCYVELVEKDVIKFGYSSREYVILHEESKYNEEDDDVLDVSE